MPAETLTIPLPPETVARLRREAEARGVSTETVAAEVVEAWMATDDDDLSWEEDLRRLAEPGENVPAEPAFAEVRARLAARLTPQK